MKTSRQDFIWRQLGRLPAVAMRFSPTQAKCIRNRAPICPGWWRTASNSSAQLHLADTLAEVSLHAFERLASLPWIPPFDEQQAMVSQIA